MSDRLGEEARGRSVEAWGRHLGAPVADPQALIAELSAGSLPEAFAATAAAGPDRPALEIDGVALTHGEVDDRAARMGGWLRAQGLAEGDAVLLAAPTSMEMVVGLLGALRAGATIVLANPTLTEAELRHLAGDSGAVIALAAGPAHDRAAALTGGALRAAVDLATFAERQDGPAPELRDAVPLDVEPAPGDRPALLAYTSGTTGKPKAVPLAHTHLLSSLRAVMRAWRWSEDDVLVHALPLFHQHGLGGVFATLLAGTRAVVHSRFGPERLCAAAASAEATVLFAVPAMYERLAAWEGASGAGLDRLRLLVSGSAPLSPQLADRIAELAGQLPLERYGTTESGLDVSNLYDGPRRPGTVGLPLPGIELALADERGEPVAPGTDGEIHLRGPQVFPGYRGDPEATAGAFRDGGWFRTGDIGRIEPDDGWLSITGRAKELIISGGMNVYPREVELALEQAPEVARAAVVGVPSERWGEEVVAAVVPAGSGAVRPDELIGFARERLAPYKCPKRVVVLDELPVNAMGKVVRAAVVELVEERG